MAKKNSLDSSSKPDYYNRPLKTTYKTPSPVNRRTTLLFITGGTFALGAIAVAVYYNILNPDAADDYKTQDELLKKILIAEDLESKLTSEELEVLKIITLSFYKSFGVPENPISFSAHTDPGASIYATPLSVQINIDNVREVAQSLNSNSPDHLSRLLLVSLGRANLESASKNLPEPFSLSDENRTPVYGYKGFSLITIDQLGNWKDIDVIDHAFLDYFARSINPNYSEPDQLSNFTSLIVQKSGLSKQDIFNLYKGHDVITLVRSIVGKEVLTSDLVFILELFTRADNNEDANSLFSEFAAKYFGES